MLGSIGSFYQGYSMHKSDYKCVGRQGIIKPVDPPESFDMGTPWREKARDLVMQNCGIRQQAIDDWEAKSAFRNVRMSAEQQQEFREFESEILQFLLRFHNGIADMDDLDRYFERAFEILKRAKIEAGATDGDSRQFNADIVGSVMSTFQRLNIQAANMAQEAEGQRLTGVSRIGADGVFRFEWSHFNAKFYFQEREMYNRFMSFGKEFAAERGFNCPINKGGFLYNLMNHTSIWACSLTHPFWSLARDFNFSEDFTPSRDFWVLHDRKNSRLTVSGETTCLIEAGRQMPEHERMSKLRQGMAIGDWVSTWVINQLLNNLNAAAPEPAKLSPDTTLFRKSTMAVRYDSSALFG